MQRYNIIIEAVADYIYTVDKNYKKLLEICSEATLHHNYEDWWWKYKLGRVYYKLTMLSEAEKQLLSSLKQNPFPNTILQLSL